MFGAVSFAGDPCLRGDLARDQKPFFKCGHGRKRRAFGLAELVLFGKLTGLSLC
jgi:hypothetical protein